MLAASPRGRPNASRSAGVTVIAATYATPIPTSASQPNSRIARTGVARVASRLIAVVTAASSIGSAVRPSARAISSAGSPAGAECSSS